MEIARLEELIASEGNIPVGSDELLEICKQALKWERFIISTTVDYAAQAGSGGLIYIDNVAKKKYRAGHDNQT